MRGVFVIANWGVDEPETMATSKVDKWAAMAKEKKAASITPQSSNSNDVGFLATHHQLQPVPKIDGTSQVKCTPCRTWGWTCNRLTPDDPCESCKKRKLNCTPGDPKLPPKCINCRRRHCNGQIPCDYCSKQGLECRPPCESRQSVKDELSSHSDLTVANKLKGAPRQKKQLATSTAHDELINPAPKQQQEPNHTRETAHLFNNAGLLIPSIPGIDPVTERLFDKGEIMSLGQSCARDNYYPDGEPLGGSFLLESSSEKKGKRELEN